MEIQIVKIIRFPMMMVALGACLDSGEPATSDMQQGEIIEVHGCRPGLLQIGEECIDPRGGGPGGGGPTGGEREPRGPGTGGGGGGGGPDRAMDPEPDRNKDRRSCEDWCSWNMRQCIKECWHRYPDPVRDFWTRTVCITECECKESDDPNHGLEACRGDCQRRFPERPRTAVGL
jgi:hypothetical protein